LVTQFGQFPQLYENPITKKIINKIMEVSGAFSPVELQVEPAMAQPQPPTPQQPPQPQLDMATPQLSQLA
jgi:hypothetical protein